MGLECRTAASAAGQSETLGKRGRHAPWLACVHISHSLSHKGSEFVSNCKSDADLFIIDGLAAQPRVLLVHNCFYKQLRGTPDTVAMTCRSPTGLPARAPHQASLPRRAPMPALATAQQQPAGLHWPLLLGFRSPERRLCPARWRASCSSAAQRSATSRCPHCFPGYPEYVSLPEPEPTQSSP